METYEFSIAFDLGSLQIMPVHVRIEQLRPIIAAHRHSNASYEIHYTQRGSGTVTIDDVTHSVGPDTLYITGPNVVHAQLSNTDDPIIEYCLYLNCRRKTYAGEDPFALFSDTVFWMGRDNGCIYPLLCRLIDENRMRQPGSSEMSEALLRQIVIQLMRIYRQGSEPLPMVQPDTALSRAGMMPVIEDAFFYRHRTLTIQDISRLLNLSIRQTQRLLQQNFGKTFSQKLSEARMAAASQYLLNTNLSITDIGSQLGFSSLEHFSAAFRRAMGCSPREYRRKYAPK